MKNTFNAFARILCTIAGIILILFFQSGISQMGDPENMAEGFDGDTSLSGLVDDRGIFCDDSETFFSLDSLIKETAEKLDMNVMVFLAGADKAHFSDEHTETFTDTLYDEVYGEHTDGLIYYLDISGKSPAYDNIMKCGKATIAFDDKTCEGIFKVLDNYLPKSGSQVYPKQIKDAVEHFCQLLIDKEETHLSMFDYYHDTMGTPPVYVYEKDGELYMTEEKAPGRRMIAFLIGDAIGFAAALITYLIIRHRYKFKPSYNASAYTSNENTTFSEKSDVLIRTYVTKHKIESSSGGGHGGGGSHHSSGHSHSGHHR